MPVGVGFGLGLRFSGEGITISPITDWTLQYAIDSYSGLWFEASDNAPGLVETWLSHEGFGQPATQPSVPGQPTEDETGLVFNGFNGFARPAASNFGKFIRQTRLPDSTHATQAGKGFTGVGLCRVPANVQISDPDLLEFWVMNFGHKHLTDIPFDSSLVLISYDPENGAMETLFEIALVPLIPTLGAVQGVTFDTTDNTLWFADITTAKIYHITQAGVLIGDDITPTWPPNGIAYNPTNDSVWICQDATGNHLEERSCVDGSIVTASANIGIANQDHLEWDDDTQTLFMTYGGAVVEAQSILVYNKPTTALVPISLITCPPEIDCIEGIVRVGKRFYIANDGFIHGGAVKENGIIACDFVPPTPPQAAYHIVANITATTGTDCIWEFGRPLSISGMGIYVSSTTNIRIIISAGGGVSPDFVFDVTVPDLSTFRIIEILLDGVEKTVSIWVDGTQIGSRSLLGFDIDVIATGGSMRISAAIDLGGRNITGTIKRLAFIPNALDRQRREGLAAWDFGLVDQLPVDHPFKARPPLIADSATSGPPVFMFDPDAEALFAAMDVQPDDAAKILYDNLILDLKTAGIWDLLDGLYLRAADTSQQALLNIVDPAAFLSVLHNAPTFTANRGFAFDGIDQYIDTTFNPSSSGGVQAQDSCSMFGWCLTTGQVDARMMGEFDGTDGMTLQTRTVTDGTAARAHQVNGSFSSLVITDGSGLFTVNRSGATAVQVYRNTTALSIGTGATIASVARNNSTLKEGTCDLAVFGAYETAAFGFGGSLTATNVTDLHAILGRYLTARGL